MLRHVLRHLGLLFGLQAVFGAIAFLLSDFRWAAVAVSLLFLVLLWQTGRSFYAGYRWKSSAVAAVAATAAGLVWQIPGLQGSLRFLSDSAGWTEYDGVTDLQDFAMETWHTVLLPLLGLIPPGQVDGYYARYYIVLTLASPLLILGFAVVSSFRNIRVARGR